MAKRKLKSELEAEITKLEAENRILRSDNAYLRRRLEKRRITNVSVGSSLVGAGMVK